MPNNAVVRVSLIVLIGLAKITTTSTVKVFDITTLFVIFSETNIKISWDLGGLFKFWYLEPDDLPLKEMVSGNW